MQFSGKVHSVSTVLLLDSCKKPFLFPFNTTTQSHWIKVEPHYVEAHGPPLSAKVSFVRIDPADWKLPGDNQGHVELGIFC